MALFHNRAVKQRAGILLALLLTGCAAFGQMTSNQVATVLAQAVTRANDFVNSGVTSNGVVAVVDREGFVLGAWSLSTNYSASNLVDQLNFIDAVTKAGTAAFLSSSQQALTSRTAGFIVGQHFPPGIKYRAPGPLVGVNFSGMSFSDVNYFKNPRGYDPFAFGGGGTNGTPIVTNVIFEALSGLAGSPGGVPLYDTGGHLIGGVGAAITGHAGIRELTDIQQSAKQGYDVDEDVALAGQIGFAPAKEFFGSQVFIGGIRLPYVNSKTVVETPLPLGSVGLPVPGYEITNSPPVNYPTITLGNAQGEMRAPIIDDPIGGSINGEARLSAAEVTNILTLSAERAMITRAGIRLPRGQPAQVFVAVVNNPNSPGVTPTILGTFRSGGPTNGATMFSWDVAVQKARTALYFSSPLAAGFLPAELQSKAISTRAVGFLAEMMYPPGIQRKPPGPLLGYQEYFSLFPFGIATNVLNGVYLSPINPPLTAPDPNLPDGITIFPGGFPLYRNGVLVGAIGVSGDGVDQDDLVAASGTVNFLAPIAIRSDQIIYRGTRLPYAKFPRNPSL